jgi:hypothetical protein
MSAMHYVTRWKMQAARTRLAEGHTLADVASAGRSKPP